MYKRTAGTAPDLAKLITDDANWVPCGPPLFDGTQYVQLQVDRTAREPLFQALRDLNCPPTTAKAEKLMSANVLQILVELNEEKIDS